MISNNIYFKSSIILIIVQQIFLALSTWFIAKSGYFVTAHRFEEVKLYLILFFIFAILGYIVSSIVSILTVKSKNISWRKYTKSTIDQISKNINLSSNDNLKKTISWISSEAPSTLGNATNFYIQFTSIILNIIFTFVVFYITLGVHISSVLLLALIISVALVFVLRKKVKESSNTLQEKNLSILTYIEPFIHKYYFGNSIMRTNSDNELDHKMNNYFSNVIRYSYLEQLIACTPIVIGVLAIVFYLFITPVSQLILFIGAIVAVLPRTLQLFGNVHALSIYSTQYIMISVKLKKLSSFSNDLRSYSIKENLDLSLINIVKEDNVIDPFLFMKEVENFSLDNGRYVIYGDNGCGKSSLLKFIKSLNKDAILLSPNTLFSENTDSLSTGIFHKRQINEILEHNSQIILLDEWDANLDKNNVKILDEVLDEQSRERVIIEVRHKLNI
ncbi:hypothetical protein [Acinetobacter soli]|uniref:hypothetical protein n=1 Tax=Acinetobacter soli TaxID=487316 RepID=UPI003A8BBC56